MFICKWGRGNRWCSLRCVCFVVSWLCLHTDTAPPSLQGVQAPIFGAKTYILCQNDNNKPSKEQPSSLSHRPSHGVLLWVFLESNTNTEKVRVRVMLLTLQRKIQTQTLEQPHCDQPMASASSGNSLTFIYYAEISFFFFKASMDEHTGFIFIYLLRWSKSNRLFTQCTWGIYFLVD